MRPKAKKWMTASTAVIAVGIWIPQILSGVVKTGDPDRPEVSNLEPGELEPPLPDMDPDVDPEMDPDMDGGMEPDALDSLPEVAEGGSTGQLGSLLEHAAEGVESLERGRERVDLDQLLRVFHDGQSGAFGSDNNLVPVETLSEDGSPARDPLLDIATRLTLNAVIDDGQDPLAMIGARLIRVGDTLPGGVRVVAIARRSVELALDGRVVRMELPPFVARPSSRSDDEDSSSVPEEETAPSEAESESTAGDSTPSVETGGETFPTADLVPAGDDSQVK